MLIGGPLQTRQAVVELIRLAIGADMTEQGVGLWLRRHGFSPQRPTQRACEQQPAAVRTWLDERYPAIEARAEVESAVIARVDQCGLHNAEIAPRSQSYVNAVLHLLQVRFPL